MDVPDADRATVEWPTYTLTVRGRLGADWQECLGGMTVSAETGAHDEVVTTLCGPLPDQAALQGVLRTVHALGLTLLSVTRVDDDRERTNT